MAAAHVLDYVLYAFLMALGVAQGLYVSCRKRRGHDVSREAFLGDRSLGVLPLAVSVLVSTASPLGLVALTAHFYAYGLHLAWNVLITVSAVPLVVYCVVPVFYRLGVTSIFEYIRMRYNAFISLTTCAIYLILTQSVGAALIFSAALTSSTIFGIPVITASIMFGLIGTYYAAIAGLRGVVWTDCLQALITLLAPLVVIGKVVYDSTVGTLPLRPLDDIEVDKYILDVSMDLTKEENVWSCLVGGVASFLYRLGFDQMVLQRYLASRNLSAAQRTAIVGVCFSGLYYLVLMAGAGALIYRFRDCDPMLSKSISALDQILPFYVKKELAPVLGFSGIFLAGVVTSSTSAVSSIINSQAAVLYVDVVAQYFPVRETWVSRTTKALAFASGIIMTAYSLAVPYIGSTMRVFVLINSAVTGPFVGLLVLAILFPFANSKGAGAAACLTIAFQVWHMIGRMYSGILPPRMPVTLDYCPDNTTDFDVIDYSTNTTDSPGSEEVFMLYRLSSFWSSFFSVIVTIAVGVVISLLTGGRKTAAMHEHLVDNTIRTAWRKTTRRQGSQSNEQTPSAPESTERTPCIPEDASKLVIDREELERLTKETQV
ncbi:sodium-dependent multivitamin transporter-like isoform X1 [Dermacentor silvarum]|uniref:sodium-dependent multivitamin transporter-like isoform X1 n=1 Tax=Dermacentor silvarum TaxID=543639 RepID=UPI001899FBA8|nr:sodium-dependent multivitamin transporter-like isoform X1 [Dermacentor silvarum]